MRSPLKDHVLRTIGLWWSALKLWLLSSAEPTVECHDCAHIRALMLSRMAMKHDPPREEKRVSWPCAAPQELGTWSPLFPASFFSGWQISCPHPRAECCCEWSGYSVAGSCSVPGSWPVAPADCEMKGPRDSNSSCSPTWSLPAAVTIFRNN